jgi:catechol 2,3-dioxygenase-like lactoylglutathione lyase family enzyme
MERLSLVCDDLDGAARFWRDTFGLVGRLTGDPLNSERTVLEIGGASGSILEYVWFPGQPGDRGDGDLRRLELAVAGDVWQRLGTAVGAGACDLLPDGRIAVLEPATGLLIVCRRLS